MAGSERDQWVLLSYRMPREPSTPRIAVWRKLERLGVARLGDGLVALPADARTREQVDWVAEEIVEASGSASVWLGRPAAREQERAIAAQMANERAEEYRRVVDRAEALAEATPAERTRGLRSLRAELRRIGRRDYFPPPEREQARAAVRAFAETVTAGGLAESERSA